MNNLSVLQRNIIHALDNPIAEKQFLRACDKADVLAAERFGFEVKVLVDILDVMLPMAAKVSAVCDEVPNGLLQFFLDRHWFWRFPASGQTS
jgi:hypothetical protein